MGRRRGIRGGRQEVGNGFFLSRGPVTQRPPGTLID